MWYIMLLTISFLYIGISRRTSHKLYIAVHQAKDIVKYTHIITVCLFNMTDVHTNEDCRCVNIDSITMSNAPSLNEVMNNGSGQRLPESTTFNQDTISISESVIVHEKINSKKKENEQINKYTILEKTYMPAILIILMCIVVVTLQIPTILYYTKLPSAEVSLLYDNIDLESCSVS